MYIYVVSLLLLGIYSIRDNKNNKNIFLIFLLFFTLLSALRYNIGTDYVLYNSFYNDNIEGMNKHLVGPAFYYLSRFINFIGGGYDWIIFLSSFLLSYSIYRVFSYFLIDDRYLLSCLFIYLTCGMYFSSYNIFRQYIAISFFLLSLVYFMEKKYLYMFIFINIAIFFHSAVMVGIFLMLFYKFFEKRDSFKILLILYIFSLIFILLNVQKLISYFDFLIPTKYINYLTADAHFLSRNKLAVLKLFVPNIVWILLMNKYTFISSMEKGKEVLIGYSFYVICNNAFYGIMVLTRITEFFFIFVPLANIYLFESYKEEKRQDMLKIVCICYYFVLTFVTIFLMNGNGVVPYQSIFSH